MASANHPAFDAALAAAESGHCPAALLEAALVEGATPMPRGWAVLGFHAAAHADLPAVETAWSMLDEGQRRWLLDGALSVALSMDQRVKSRGTVRLLVRLAGLPMLKAHAVAAVEEARCDGRLAFAQALATLDALTEHVADAPAWATFCLDQHGWDPRLMPSTSAVHRAMAQRSALTPPGRRPPHRRRG